MGAALVGSVVGAAVGGLAGAVAGAVLAKLLDVLAIMPDKPTEMPQVPGKTEDQLRDEAQRALGIDSVNHFNFAFSGFSGVGKSSLINAVRLLKDSDPGAAPIGVTETTHLIKKYGISGYPHVLLWDIPGAGTESHKAETYFMDNKLYAFDFLLIVTGNRITEIDIALAKNAVEAGVPVGFVRSKSDQDLMNESERNDCQVSDIKEAYRKRISSYMRRQLPPGLQNAQLFIVSAKVFCLKKYAEYKLDEDRLLEWVLRIAQGRFHYTT